MNAELLVYRVYGRRGALLYVGVTGDLHKRFRAHSDRTPWWPEVQRWTTDGPFPQAEALRVEATAIATERPKYNVTHAAAGTSRPRYTPRDVARMWSVSAQHVVRLALAGDLTCRVSDAGQMTFRDDDLAAYIDAHTSQTPRRLQAAHAP